MDKKDVAEVLQIVLDGLTAGESTEKKLEETKKFYETELARVNEENRFYQSIIRVNLFGDYVNFKEGVTTRFEVPSGSKLFQHQLQFNDSCQNQALPGVPRLKGFGVDLEEFSKFVEDYIAAARNDSVIGIKDKEI